MSRLIFLLLASASLCARGEIPLIPGDNSKYIEGVSRYFWMPDGHDIPRLVDSQEPVDNEFLANRKSSDNQYWLYTRDNPTTRQILVDGDINSVTSSNYVATRPLIGVVHGWRSDGNSGVNTMVTSSVLNTSNANVIVLDWSDLADTFNYFTAAAGVQQTGEYFGGFLTWLISNAGGDWNNVHLIGHSLGAHVVGIAGRQSGGKAARITGLDPAKPTFEQDDGVRIKNTDGIYVEIMHTDGNVLGIFKALGHADFYPNGGTNPQPGCLISTCSHSRSYQLFASSITTDKFVGVQCASEYDAHFGNCRGATLNMGNNILTKRGSGIYYLKTGKEYPF